MDFVLYGNPVTKKNSMEIRRNRTTGRVFIGQSKAYRLYARECLRQVARKYKRAIDYPVNLRCVYYRSSRRRVDLNNLLSATCDILVDAGVLKDDNCRIIFSQDGSRVLYDKECPRVEVSIERVGYN